MGVIDRAGSAEFDSVSGGAGFFRRRRKTCQ